MIPLWIDSDPSGLYHTGLDCDDDLAILVALSLHQRRIINLEGLSICGGNAPLRHTWNDIQMLWKYVDGYQIVEGVSPVKGYGWKSMQGPIKLLKLYNNYFLSDVHDSQDASIAIAERALDAATQQHAEQGRRNSINILTLGPPTNVANAIQHNKDIIHSIEHIYLMGGELTNSKLDLNFRSDVTSARIILESNIPKTIIPIQTCAQVSVTESWLSSLKCNDESSSSSSADNDTKQMKKKLAVCAYMSKMKQQLKWMPIFVNQAVKKRMIPSSSSLSSSDVHYWKVSPNIDVGFIPWDIVALLSITHPHEFLDWKYHRVNIPRCDKNNSNRCDGRMKLIEDLGNEFLGGNWSGVVRIPHRIHNETRLLEIMLDLVKDIEVSVSSQQPRMQLGFIADFVGFGIATCMFLICCIRLLLLRR